MLFVLYKVFLFLAYSYRHADCFLPESRALLNASYLSLLRTYTSSPANSPVSEALLKMLQSPRIRNVDLNQLDASSGGALIHEAVRRKDLRLIELAVRSGADVFVRDRRGRGVVELAGKDDRMSDSRYGWTLIDRFSRDKSLLAPVYQSK